MSAQDFKAGLQGLGFEVTELTKNKFTFPYLIPVGPKEGESVTLGFEVADDFPANPPSGPYVSPRILPINPDQSPGHPRGGVHDRDFEGNGNGLWEYWSRPFTPSWADTDRSVKTYMAFVRRLFATLEP